MLSCRAEPRTSSTAEDYGHRTLTAVHIAGLSCLIDDVVHHIDDEVHEGHVDDRTHTRQSSTDSTARDGILRDRGITYTFAPELFKHTDGSTEVTSIDTDIFTDEEYILIPTHLFAHRFDDRIAYGHHLCFLSFYHNSLFV